MVLTLADVQESCF